MRRRSHLFSNDSQIVIGIEESLYDGIVLAYQSNNQDILFDTIATVDEITYFSISSCTFSVFIRNLPLIRSLYKISFNNGKFSTDLKIKSYDAIRSKITSILYRVESNNYERDNEELVKSFLRYGLTQYNILLHEILINKDFDVYKEAINQFYTYIFKKNLNAELNKTKTDLNYEAEYYINSVAILQYSWITFLYKKGKITKQECITYLNENKFSARNYERVLDTLMYIDGIAHYNAFGVEEWENDITKINHSIARSPLQPKQWTTLGMMIYLLKNSALVTREINPNRIRSRQTYFEMYFEDFQAALSEIGENKDIWIPIIFNNTLSDITEKNPNHEKAFFDRINYLSVCLDVAGNQLMKIEFLNANKELVLEPFSKAKALEFKEAVGSQWYGRSFLHKLFENYGNWEAIENNEAIIPIGRFVFQEGMKMMFVEKGYNFVYGSGDFGGLIADYEDGDFLKSIKKDETPVRSFNGILECLDSLIESIEANKFTPSAIILGSHWIYANNDLAHHKDFIPDWKLKDESDEYNSTYSLYKGIQLFTSYNEEFETYIVVSDFENAFKLNQVRNENWYKNQLQVDTLPIDDEEAQRQFNRNPTAWKFSPKGIELSKDEALNYIKTGVIWDIHIRETFEIKNQLAYSIGQIYIPNENIEDSESTMGLS